MPDIAIVTGPFVDAEVLYNFNAPRGADTAWRKVLREGFSIGAPNRQGEADAIAPLYDGRMLSWQQRFIGTKPRALAGMAELARRLMRGPSWLRVLLADGVDPIWFRTQWPEPGDLSFDHVSADPDRQDYWTVPMRIPVEKYALGPLVTQDMQVVAGDPTAATNPCRLVLPPIKGDAPAPLRFDIRPTTSFADAHRMLVNVHAGDTVRTPIAIPIGTNDGWTALDPDTSEGGNEAGYVGGNRRQVTFATSPSLIPRLTRTQVVAPGRYQAFLRINVTTDDTVRLRLNNAPVVTTSVATPGAGAQWVDLGRVDLPARRPRSAADVGPDVEVALELSAGRATGTGTIRLKLDVLLLVPVDLVDSIDSRAVSADYSPAHLFSTTTATLDGDSGDAWTKITATGALAPGLEPAVAGVFPVGVPGAENVATLLGVLGPTYSGDSLTRDLRVVVSYHPQLLWLGDGA